MAHSYIDNEEQLAHALHFWKGFSFASDYISVDEAVETLDSSDKVVEARPVYASRWVMCPAAKKGTKEAILHIAGVWGWNSDLETGNFVPKGETASAKVAESRVRSVPDNVCQFSYALDTTTDKCIWDVQRSFEEHVEANPNFNKSNKSRRAWQDGSEAFMSSYIFSSQVFMRRNRMTAHREAHIPYKLHPWIAAATGPKSGFFANPNKPKIFELCNDELRAIEECSPPYIKKGDLVWMSFSVEFIIGADAWSTTCVPYEIVRVGTLSPDLLGMGGSSGGGTEVEAPHAQLKAGLKVMRNFDFPMHDTPSEVASATSTSGTYGTRGGEEDAARAPENDVSFGPEDASTVITDDSADSPLALLTPDDEDGIIVPTPSSAMDSASEGGRSSPEVDAGNDVGPAPGNKRRQADSEVGPSPSRTSNKRMQGQAHRGGKGKKRGT